MSAHLLCPSFASLPRQLTKSFRRAPRLVYGCVKALGLLYLLTMATCTIAGRKHYTVDVALAIVIAGLTFFRFQVRQEW